MAITKLGLIFNFSNYFLQLHGNQLSILHSQLLITKLLYYMSPNMVYTRIIGSRQIGNYLAGLSRQIAFPLFKSEDRSSFKICSYDT